MDSNLSPSSASPVPNTDSTRVNPADNNHNAVNITRTSPTVNNNQTAINDSAEFRSQDDAYKANNSVVQEDLLDIDDADWKFENETIIDTRRILRSSKVAAGKRPYMVPTLCSINYNKYEIRL